jgi:hypothetical protein
MAHWVRCLSLACAERHIFLSELHQTSGIKMWLSWLMRCVCQPVRLMWKPSNIWYGPLVHEQAQWPKSPPSLSPQSACTFYQTFRETCRLTASVEEYIEQETSVKVCAKHPEHGDDTLSRNVGWLCKWLHGVMASNVPYSSSYKTEKILNSVAWVRDRTIPTERQPLFNEISANFCG